MLMNNSDFQDLIDIKLQTTRDICDSIIHSNLTGLNHAAKAEFADMIELFAVLMLEHAGEFPEDWSSDSLTEIYHHKLPTLLDVEERKNIKDILFTYVDFVGQALELPNYLDIKSNLAS